MVSIWGCRFLFLFKGQLRESHHHRHIYTSYEASSWDKSDLMRSMWSHACRPHHPRLTKQTNNNRMNISISKVRAWWKRYSKVIKNMSIFILRGLSNTWYKPIHWFFRVLMLTEIFSCLLPFFLIVTSPYKFTEKEKNSHKQVLTMSILAGKIWNFA